MDAALSLAHVRWLSLGPLVGFTCPAYLPAHPPACLTARLPAHPPASPVCLPAEQKWLDKYGGEEFEAIVLKVVAMVRCPPGLPWWWGM